MIKTTEYIFDSGLELDVKEEGIFLVFKPTETAVSLSQKDLKELAAAIREIFPSEPYNPHIFTEDEIIYESKENEAHKEHR